MAKASKADIDMAMDLAGSLEALGNWYPTMPASIENVEEDDDDESERFDKSDDAQCGRAMRHLLDVMGRGSLFRVVFGMSVLMDPRNKCVDPDADTLEHHPDAEAGFAAKEPKALDEWHEDMGNVLWWCFPIEEPPYVGTPNCSDWPGYHTHWTPLIVPNAPAMPADGSV